MEKTYMYLDGEKHTVGDYTCGACWGDYPLECDCGGLIHASFGDEMEDGYWLYSECDKCGYRETV